MVGIVHKIRFTPSNSATFSGYIDYIDRDEATRNYSFKDFSLYNDYMGNPKKSGSLFTSDKDFLSSQETKILKENFKLAQKKGSIMWQDVFSFDNKWLEQQGLYNAKSHTVDEKKIMSAVRSTMAELMKKEKLDSLVWSASFHYNTDNIHVHVASVELNNPKERGFRKNSTREMMKSKFANVLLDRSNENKKINDLIRNNIINKKEISLLNDKEIKRLTLEIIKRLPSDKKQWSYGYNSINDAKPFIDKITKYYLENYKKEEFKTLILELNKEKNFYKEVYGEREDKSIKSFEENKIEDLYKRMGNVILKEVKEIVVEEELKNNKNKDTNKIKTNATYNTENRPILLTKKDINRIKKALCDDFSSYKNQKAYERLQWEIEHSR